MTVSPDNGKEYFGLIFNTSVNDMITDTDKDRIIEIAWEDRTPFEAISIQFGFAEADVFTLMRRYLKRGSFNLCRKRVHSGISQKHAGKRNPEINRFKSRRQRNISMNKISKR